jgi:hypothetical protein
MIFRIRHKRWLALPGTFVLAFPVKVPGGRHYFPDRRFSWHWPVVWGAGGAVLPVAMFTDESPRIS